MKVVLIGYGKMGKAIEEVILSNPQEGIEIIQKYTRENTGELNSDNLSKADVVIEFTTPETAVQNIKICFDAGVPVITGTTGWYDHLDDVKDYCDKKDGAFLYAANFSIGVNIFFEINKKLSQLMADQPQYQLRVEETHHIQKLDAPSGTAIKIAEQIIENDPKKNIWINTETDDKNAVEIISHRKENIPGTHEVIYTSAADEIKITHTAFSRKGFAEGAVAAAKWIREKKGIFTMQDVLGI